MKYVKHVLICWLALWLSCRFFPEAAAYSSWESLLLGAVVLSLLYTFVRPVLQLAASPITLLTCGAFIFIINAGLVKLSTVILGGIRLEGFWLCLGVALFIAIWDNLTSKLIKLQN